MTEALTGIDRSALLAERRARGLQLAGRPRRPLAISAAGSAASGPGSEPAAVPGG